MMLPLFLALALSAPARQGTDAPPPPSPAPAPAPVQAPGTGVAWFDKAPTSGLAQARLQERPAVVYFRAEWNGFCQRMDSGVFATAEAARALEGATAIRVDYDKQREVADRYRVKEVPAVIWFNPDGSVRDRVDGFQTLEVFLANAARVKADLGTFNELRRKIAANADDLDARFDLYQRLDSVGDSKGMAEQRAEIEKRDPEGRSRGSRHFRYLRITSEIEQHWAATQTLDMNKVAALQALVEAETEPWIVWDGWMRLSNTHKYLGDQAKAQGKAEEEKQHRAKRREYLGYAWRGVPERQVESWGSQYGQLLWEEREELSEQDKEFFVAMTTSLAQTFADQGIMHDLHARALSLVGKQAEALEAARKASSLEPANTLFSSRVKQLGG